MDAKPQRPARAIHALGDENVAPTAVNIKNKLHQRHKSTSNISDMSGLGGLKAAAKRTAFGDVSNTARNMAAIHDDHALPNKQTIHEFVKPLATQDKPAALLRPAQRPLNVTSKATLSGPSAIQSEPMSLTTTSKASLADIRQAVQAQPANKRTLSKKGTTIYKDTVNESEGVAIQQVARPDVASVAPVHQTLGPRTQKSLPQLVQDQPDLNGAPSNQMAQQSNSSVPAAPIAPINNNAPQQAQNNEPTSGEVYHDYLRSMGVSQAPAIPESTRPSVEAINRQRRSLHAATIGSEPEEYWEDEEEEIYDEQGYTTAHSFRSRTDNTTGGATTVLVPKVTLRAKKELADAKLLVESCRTQEEIEDEAWDTSMVAEYGDEIFAYMRVLENKMLPNAHYMDNQAEIQWSMRSVLMDWLIQVHHRFSLLPETLFLCVNYIDRFLSCKIVSLGKLQLVGATAIFVAAKYEEINCPSVNEIVYMVDGGYTVDEILKAERFMLSMLQFELGWPGPMSFLRRISKADDYDLETRTLAKYFLEVTIMDERFVGSPPSYIAAGAHCLSRLMLKKGEWTSAHVYYSEYTWTQLRPLVAMMMQCCENPQKHHAAVFDKYSDRRYKRASLFVKTEMNQGFTLPAAHVGIARQSLPSMDDVDAQLSREARRVVQVKG